MNDTIGSPLAKILSALSSSITIFIDELGACFDYVQKYLKLVKISKKESDFDELIPLEANPESIQTAFVQYSKDFLHYNDLKNRTACAENSMSLIFQLSLGYYQMMFLNPQVLSYQAPAGIIDSRSYSASTIWIWSLILKLSGVIASSFSMINGLATAYIIKEQLQYCHSPGILKIFAFCFRITVRVAFFTFYNLSILIFLLNATRSRHGDAST